MFRDLIEYLRAPYPWHLAPMGYLRELDGIGRRERQCAESWEPHLSATRRVVLQAAEACPPGGRALVVGSGLLLDVPLDALCRHFDEVILADIVQPQAVRGLLKGNDKVSLERVDITGIAKPVYDVVRNRKPGALPRAKVTLFHDRQIDFVASVNLLSQLSVIPCQYLRTGLPGLPPGQVTDFAKDLVKAHLRWLSGFAGRVALVTDHTRIEEGPEGTIEQRSIVEGVALPEGGARWTWDIAPRGSVFADLAVRHEVVGYADFGAAFAAGGGFGTQPASGVDPAV